MMSSEEENNCYVAGYPAELPEEVTQTQIEEDRKFDCNSQLPKLKRENEQTDPTPQELPHFNNYNYDADAFAAYPIKKEPEDFKYDVRMIAENDVALKEEEVDIEEHKPGLELIKGTGTSDFGTFNNEQHQSHSIEKSNSATGSRSEEQAKYNCAHCAYKANKRTPFLRHYNRKHKQCSHMYMCCECSYGTTIKRNLIQHYRFKHSKDAEVYKCQDCAYETKYKNNLSQHYNNKHSKDAEMYKCQECSYKTKRKRDLTRHHKIKHVKDAEVYKCRECAYETKYKNNFTKHYEYRHDRDSEVYKCEREECSYETKYKGALTQHFKRKHLKDT